MMNPRTNGSPIALFTEEQWKDHLAPMSNIAIHNAAVGFSRMVGETLTVTNPLIRLVPLANVPYLLGGPENEAVGIYLRIEGELAGQIMLVIPYDKALELVDLMMYLPPGTTTLLGPLERSALGELGNMAGTFFINAIAEMTGRSVRPTPPAVMVDMIGAILDILVATWDGISENVLLIQATFLRGERETQVNFWMIPDRVSLEGIGKRDNSRSWLME